MNLGVGRSRVMGPVDCPIARFQQMKSGGEVLPGIAFRVRGGIIRAIYLVSIARDEEGELVKVEAKHLEGQMGDAYGVRGGTPTGGSPKARSGSSRSAWRGDRCRSKMSVPSASGKGVDNPDTRLIDTGGIPPEAIPRAENQTVSESVRCPGLRERMLLPAASARARRNRPRREAAQSGAMKQQAENLSAPHQSSALTVEEFAAAKKRLPG
jgi:hypothetical protein